MKNMTELVQKYQDEEQFPRMVGTGGEMDYLIVAKDEAAGLQLGIKPMFGLGNVQGKTAVLVSFRLRSARIPGASGSVTSIADGETQGASPKAPHEGWEFPWEKVGQSYTGPRASLIRTLALSRSAEDASFIFDDLDHVRFYGKVSAFLHEHVPDEQFVVTDEDVASFFKASFYPQILHLQAASGDPVKQLELLELAWVTKVEDHAKHQEQYEAKKAELLAKIAEKEAGGEPAYQPKAHFGDDELMPMDSVAHAVLKGAKPKLSVVDGDDDEDESEEYNGKDPETADGPSFESTEPDMSAEADHEGPTAA